MVAFLTVHKMTKRQPAKKATGAFMAVANRHIYLQRSSTVCSTHLLGEILGIRDARRPLDPCPASPKMPSHHNAGHTEDSDDQMD